MCVYEFFFGTWSEDAILIQINKWIHYIIPSRSRNAIDWETNLSDGHFGSQTFFFFTDQTRNIVENINNVTYI